MDKVKVRKRARSDSQKHYERVYDRKTKRTSYNPVNRVRSRVKYYNANSRVAGRFDTIYKD